ncbi:MAG: hypothetical protein HWE30_18995 [Methylocystaceae bacterium]|nr:hypothetical protein [Methylocystaceae bacterium]
MKINAALLALLLLPSTTAAQQGFSCSWGDRGACLGYGETICSSSGKCVSANAACFDTYQCDYQGFTCRSNVTDCAERYDQLLSEHNTLVNDYNSLLQQSRDLLSSLESAEDELRLVVLNSKKHGERRMK